LKLFKSDFLKNVGKLFTGSLIAQVIGFVALIFLAKIYTPEEVYF